MQSDEMGDQFLHSDLLDVQRNRLVEYILCVAMSLGVFCPALLLANIF